MAREYTWYRGPDGDSAVGVGERVRLNSPAIPAAFTLERVIFGFQVWHQFAEGVAPSPPSSVRLYGGLILQNTAFGLPDADPFNNPSGDWLWSGEFAMRSLHRSGGSGTGFDLGWWSDERQIDVTTRRLIGGTASYWVVFCTNAPPQNAANTLVYNATVYMQVLVSRPA